MQPSDLPHPQAVCLPSHLVLLPKYPLLDRIELDLNGNGRVDIVVIVLIEGFVLFVLHLSRNGKFDWECAYHPTV